MPEADFPPNVNPRGTVLVGVPFVPRETTLIPRENQFGVDPRGTTLLPKPNPFGVDPRGTKLVP